MLNGAKRLNDWNGSNGHFIGLLLHEVWQELMESVDFMGIVARGAPCARGNSVDQAVVPSNHARTACSSGSDGSAG